MALADEMTRYRAIHRMSQKVFAQKCGVTVQTICSIETGQQTPSRVTEQKIRIAMEDKE